MEGAVRTFRVASFVHYLQKLRRILEKVRTVKFLVLEHFICVRFLMLTKLDRKISL